jgi:hypothetical protein
MQVHTKNECSVSEYSEGIEQEDAMQQNVAKVCVCACVQQGSALSNQLFSVLLMLRIGYITSNVLYFVHLSYRCCIYY